MVDKKLTFAVEDVRVTDERNDSQFAEVEIDVFASGPNKHDLIISVDTLKKTAKTILMKPLVFVYDKIFDDLGSHSPNEVPGGFIPADSPISYRELSDGRTMMTILGRIWKRYSGELLSIFERDGDKPISVELEVYETNDSRPDGLIELLDYCYTAITILGSMVTPAIPDAKMSVIKFAEEYEEDYKKEFSNKYSELDLSIPESIKKNAEKAQSLHQEHEYGLNSTVLALSRHLTKNTHADPEKIHNMAKLLSRYAKKDLGEKNSPAYIAYLALGGDEGFEWALDLAEKISEIDKQKLSYFNGNVESNDSKEKEVIKNFMEDEKKEEVKEEREENKEEEPKKEEMAQETPEEEKKEDPEEEAKETPEEEAKEHEQEKKEEKMSNDVYLDVAAALAFLRAETESNREMVDEEDFALFAEMEKGADCDPKMMAKGMFCKMQKMSKLFADMKKKHDEMMAENEELKKFKAKVEEDKFVFEIATVMSEVKEDMPKEEFEALQEKSKEFSLENVDLFKNLARAKAFEFSKGKKKNNDDIVRHALPVVTNKENKKSLWAD